MADAVSRSQETGLRLITEQTGTHVSEYYIRRFMKRQHLQDIKATVRDNPGKGAITFVSFQMGT